jgi:hypothetical protein
MQLRLQRGELSGVASYRMRDAMSPGSTEHPR